MARDLACVSGRVEMIDGLDRSFSLQNGIGDWLNTRAKRRGGANSGDPNVVVRTHAWPPNGTNLSPKAPQVMLNGPPLPFPSSMSANFHGHHDAEDFSWR